MLTPIRAWISHYWVSIRSNSVNYSCMMHVLRSWQGTWQKQNLLQPLVLHTYILHKSGRPVSELFQKTAEYGIRTVQPVVFSDAHRHTYLIISKAPVPVYINRKNGLNSYFLHESQSRRLTLNKQQANQKNYFSLLCENKRLQILNWAKKNSRSTSSPKVKVWHFSSIRKMLFTYSQSIFSTIDALTQFIKKTYLILTLS